MASPQVLQIGIDPSVVDFSGWPGQDANTFLARLDEARAALEAAGYEVTTCLVPDDATAAEPSLRRSHGERRFDVIEIGSGLRTSHDYTPIFERAVNVAAELQPGVPFCFNDSPESTLEAVRRVLPSTA